MKQRVETKQKIVSNQKYWEDTVLNDEMCNYLMTRSKENTKYIDMN